MNRDIAFGQYYPADSFMHKLDPRAKLIFVLAYTVGVFLVRTLYSYIPIAAFLIIAILLSKVPFIKVLKSLKGIIFVIVFTSLLNIFFVKDGDILVKFYFIKITSGGLYFAVNFALRIMLLVLGTSILTLTTTPMNITDGMESLMSPLKLLKLPVHDFALVMSVALRFIPILMEEIDKIMMAQKARGASFDTGGLLKRAKALLPVIIPLIVSAFRRAEDLALALDSRCYNATPNRVKLKKLTFSVRDLIGLIFTAVLIFLIIAVNIGFWGLFGAY